ncbi:MAG: hypothetical protein ABI333_00150 [bacterium]
MNTYYIPLVTSVVVLLAAGGCKEKTSKKAGPDQGIKEIQKSGALLKADADDLLKRRGKLQDNRREIEAARKAIEAKRATLAKDDIQGHAKLAKEELDLKDREQKLRKQEDKVNGKLLNALRRQEQFYVRAAAVLQSRGGGDASSNIRSREHGVALRENAVARREKAVAGREKALNDQYRKIVEYKAKKCATTTSVFTTLTAPSIPAGGGGAGYSKADAKNAYAKAMATMAGKGILISDLPSGFAKLISSIKKSIGAKEYARAKIGADQLRATLRSITIDRGFVGAKMGRLAGYIRRKKLSDAKRAQVNKLFVQVTTAYNDGRFGSANRKINKIYGVIR